MEEFTVRAIAVQELPDLNTFLIGLYEDEGGAAGHRLEIQRSLIFDEQDRALGQDTYSVSTGTGATHYGGIRRWSLGPDQLILQLDADAQEELGTAEGFQLKLAVPDELVAQLDTALRKVVGAPVDDRRS